MRAKSGEVFLVGWTEITWEVGYRTADCRTGAKSGEVFLVGRTEITWEVGGRLADGRTGAKSGEVFFGRREGRTADGGQKEK